MPVEESLILEESEKALMENKTQPTTKVVPLLQQMTEIFNRGQSI